MSEQDYQLLSQYLDGELAAPDAQSLRKRLLADPGLRAEFEQMKSANTRLSQAFDNADLEQVPERVSQLLQAGDNVTHLPQRRRAVWGLAVAATVLAASGLLLAPDWQQAPDRDALLAEILEHSPSRGEGWDTLLEGEQLRPVLSFRSVEGSWCREYLSLRDGSSARGVACRENGQWQTLAQSEVSYTPSSLNYIPASAADADEVAAFIDKRAADIPLNASQEATLIASDWQ